MKKSQQLQSSRRTASGSSSNESPPPEPKAAEFKSLSHIVIPGTAEFEQAGDSKYLTMAGLGLKQEKEEQKFTDAKYQNGSSSAPAAWSYPLPTASYSIYNNFYTTPPNYYHQYGYTSDYTPQNPSYCGQL
ncbi:unnamed protein product [Heligmosomoides polygyrus]|uniref:Uncharacterized protein n=1 Tax=Heligmosomoides polygyrus TaxID=6339 RepID=A0A3P8CBE6_HELPZ|nr:unnamed protein product [Heligmosomoides polygyrus]